MGLDRGAVAGSETVEQETTRSDPEVLGAMAEKAEQGAMAEQARLKQGA